MGEKRETGSAQSGEKQPSEKVKTVHQQIRQQCTIHHVPGLSEEARAQIETSKIITQGSHVTKAFPYSKENKWTLSPAQN